MAEKKAGLKQIGKQGLSSTTKANIATPRQNIIKPIEGKPNAIDVNKNTVILNKVPTKPPPPQEPAVQLKPPVIEVKPAPVDNSNDVYDLKKRLEKSELELKALSDAMKSTLVEVRSMVQEFDNPFNLLRDMGIDSLVDKAVEGVENEVNKAKRDEALKRMSKSPDAYTPTTMVNQPLSEYQEQKPSENISQNKRLDVLENVVKDLAETLDLALDEFKGMYETSLSQTKKPLQNTSKMPTLAETPNEIEGVYQAYIQLVSEYLAIRFGRRGAEVLLLNEIAKNQASPKVVKDILDCLASRVNKLEEQEEALPFKYSLQNADLDDKILITTLLQNLDKPTSSWSSAALLFMLTTLVRRASEVKLSRN
ncbi:MAG: hypothetical protein NTY03_02320 [Candidatus Bathyarchaeota archaeon]|jgi:hypothetical protein|nr:hypothetical protein [Candidatus Bathyarchaeota archaeon]